MDDERTFPGSRVSVKISPDTIIGDGLYLHNGQVYASRIGYLRRENIDQQNRLFIWPPSAPLPAIGQTILGTVSRLTAKYAAIDIQILERGSPGLSDRSVLLPQSFRGTLRSTEIWPEVDREAATQPMYRSIRPGDVIRARIIGVGEASAGFLLSTAIDEGLGVVFARCAASGEPLVPISWKEMMCSKTGIREPRKAARPTTTTSSNSSND